MLVDPQAGRVVTHRHAEADGPGGRGSGLRCAASDRQWLERLPKARRDHRASTQRRPHSGSGSTWPCDLCPAPCRPRADRPSSAAKNRSVDLASIEWALPARRFYEPFGSGDPGRTRAANRHNARLVRGGGVTPSSPPRQRPTRRQLEVLRAYIGAGPIKLVAHELGISEPTTRWQPDLPWQMRSSHFMGWLWLGQGVRISRGTHRGSRSGTGHGPTAGGSGEGR